MVNGRFTIVDGKLHFKTKAGVLSVPKELEDLLEESASDFFSEAPMPMPSHPNLPFFAYGLFKPGQLGFDSIRPYVLRVDTDESMDGVLYERDGVPLFVRKQDGSQSKVKGALMRFTLEKVNSVYKSIAAIEPERQYKWEVHTTTKGVEANVLVARTTKGGEHLEGSDWNGRTDPLFNEALEMVDSIANTSVFEMGSVKRLMELQMAYMLLWTAIERYTSLRYHLRKRVMAKIRPMAMEPGFQAAYAKYVKEPREVFSTEAGKPILLRPDDAKGAINYYYQVRNNITHRGKAMMVDSGMLLDSIKELTAIFRETVARAFDECRLDFPVGKVSSSRYV